MSRKVWELEHISRYRDFVMGTWMEGPCTDDSKGRSGRLWKWSIYFVRFHKGNLKALSRGWLGQYVIGPEPVLIFFSVMCNLEVGGLIFLPQH